MIWLSVTITILSIIFAAISNAVMDKIQFHFKNSIFPDTDWVNPDKSWDNEYVKSKILTYLLATIFAWTTDLFHLAKFMWLKFILIAILSFNIGAYQTLLQNTFTNTTIIYTVLFFGLWILYSFTFELFFGILFDKGGIRGYIKKYTQTK